MLVVVQSGKGNPRTRKINILRGEERRKPFLGPEQTRLELEKRSSGCMSGIALCPKVGVGDSERMYKELMMVQHSTFNPLRKAPSPTS
jgi:hypothetical protein